jgi:hypothetical protein
MTLDLTPEEARQLLVALELALDKFRDAQTKASQHGDHLTRVFLEGKITDLRLIRTRLANYLARLEG